MAVGEMMRDLPDGPPAGAIGRVELRIVEAGDCTPEIRRCGGDLLDCGGTVGRRELLHRCKLADRISLVAHLSTRQFVVSSVVPHLMRTIPLRLA